VQLRRSLRDIHDNAGLTPVFVTHDQDEALDLADRVAIRIVASIRDGPAVAFVRPYDVLLSRADSRRATRGSPPRNSPRALHLCFGPTRHRGACIREALDRGGNDATEAARARAYGSAANAQSPSSIRACMLDVTRRSKPALPSARRYGRVSVGACATVSQPCVSGTEKPARQLYQRRRPLNRGMRQETGALLCWVCTAARNLAAKRAAAAMRGGVT
jgi:hypothetical protein